MGTVSNIRVEPMSATWGESVYNVQTITCVADVADSLDGKYFFIYATDGTKYHVWYNTSGGAASDPAPAGSTAKVVAITTGDSATAVGIATEAVIEAITEMDSTVASGVITVTHSAYGYVQPAHEGVGTGFSFGTTTEGDTAVDLGFVDGDIEVSISEDLVDVKGHETGSNTITQIRTGKQVEIKVSLQETSVTQLKKLYRQGGQGYTPAGAAGTQLVGWGSSKDFTQTLTQAKKLVLHPKVLGTSDKTRDMTFHLCYPQLDSITFSGENTFVIPVTFKVYPKYANNDAIEYFAFGDGSQTLT